MPFSGRLQRRLLSALGGTMRNLETSPEYLDGAKVICFAVFDETVKYTGATVTSFQGEEVNTHTTRVAICRYEDEAEYLLFHCDDSWRVLGVGGDGDFTAVKHWAEKTYQRVSKLWRDAA
ncbi:MAG: hypothetical protein QNJ73_07645 [Gammaproteobacteria bacterium]|nr:hypothetical protein [Gammaproteobacteria bacterium]